MGPYIHGLHMQTSPKTKGPPVGVCWHWMSSDNVVIVAQPSGYLIFGRDFGPVRILVRLVGCRIAVWICRGSGRCCIFHHICSTFRLQRRSIARGHVVASRLKAPPVAGELNTVFGWAKGPCAVHPHPQPSQPLFAIVVAECYLSLAG